MLDEAFDAWRVAASWRKTHAYPLALVTPGVRNWLGQCSGQMVVAQRLKRSRQMVIKLARFRTMRLSPMEDIAGCRAVLADNAEVEAVAAKIDRHWMVQNVADYREQLVARRPGRALRAARAS
jgi:hypothetical protein